MGLLGAIGKMAGSKVVEKVEGELTKKQNREQTSSYCNYIKNNMVRVCKLLSDLQTETRVLIEQVSESKGAKLSFKEKGNIRKVKEKLNQNLEYLYLARDFFTALSKNASGVVLKNEELMLVTKFAPYFDGVPVLDIDDDEDSDDSLLGAFKEVGQELKEAFISSKKSSTYFSFEDYLSRYEEKIGDCIMPDIDSAIETFKNAMAAQEVVVAQPVANTVMTPPPIPTSNASDKIECPNCGTMLDANAKFCLECGSKIEIKKPAFCSECGEALAPGAKFCSGCGYKVM